MSTIHLHQTTTSTPEQYVAGLTDFGPGRSKLFGNSTDEYLKVHDRGPSQADVTEGSGGIWERLHYDWSDPNHRRPQDDRLQHVGRRLRPHLHLHTSSRWFDRHRRSRRPRRQNLKGRLLGVVLGTIGTGVLKKAFENSVRAIEARNGGASAARS
jgi:hypothetical protein